MKRLALLATALFVGLGAVGAPCDAYPHHGFNGIEDQVVEDISAFIRNRS
jgi:hypothetical protein